MSGQCELCVNGISIRVFPCLYHCKKMLCIEHLAEHDQLIEKQIQLQKQLENLWTNFRGVCEEQIRKLQMKIDSYRKLKEQTENLLLIKHFHHSIEHQENFQRAIQMIENAIDEENQMKISGQHERSFTLNSEEIFPKIETESNHYEEDRSAIDYGKAT